MRQVFSARSSEEAHIVRQMLDDAGVRAVVLGDILLAHSMPGMVPAGELGPTVWVGSDDDYVRACELIEEYAPPAAAPTHCEECGYDLRGLPEPRCPECGSVFYRPKPCEQLPDWTCPACGEKHAGQFTECWKCGAVRPEMGES